MEERKARKISARVGACARARVRVCTCAREGVLTTRTGGWWMAARGIREKRESNFLTTATTPAR